MRDPLTVAALRDLLRSIGARKGNLQVYDPRAQVLRMRAQVGFSPGFLERFRGVNAEEGSVCGVALKTRLPVVARDVFAEYRFFPLREIFREEGLVGVISRPIIGDDGGVLGMVSAHFNHPVDAEPPALRRYALAAGRALGRERERNSRAAVS